MPVDRVFLTERADQAIEPYRSGREPFGIPGDEGLWVHDYEFGEIPCTPANLRRYERALAKYEQEIAAHKEAERQAQAAVRRQRGPEYRSRRDLVTIARRSWADRHLEPLLDARWRAPLRKAAESYAAARSARSRELTERQFCTTAVRDMANAWSGGNLIEIALVLGLEREITRW